MCVPFVYSGTAQDIFSIRKKTSLVVKLVKLFPKKIDLVSLFFFVFLSCKKVSK
jgi:hypothetical protein